jgi:hypothetical protein
MSRARSMAQQEAARDRAEADEAACAERNRYDGEPSDGARAPKLYRPPTPAEIATGEIAPFVTKETAACEHCGGDGQDHRQEPFTTPHACRACNGKRTITVKRRWLAEAFAIVAENPPGGVQRIERGHMIALATYSRMMIAALTPRFPQ